jgi:V/A-type H+/Na+-transporting ATPase subunit E
VKEIQHGQIRVKEIAEVLKGQTLEPAKKEAADVVAKAKRQGHEIVEEAKRKADMIIADARKELERENELFKASLRRAFDQTIERLKEAILDRFFSKYLKELIAKNVSDPKALAQLISVLVKAIEKEGTAADLSAYISAAIPATTVNEHLLKEIVNALREKSVLLSGISGGVMIKIHENNMILDISVDVLEEMIAERIREDFREMIFAKS